MSDCNNRQVVVTQICATNAAGVKRSLNLNTVYAPVNTATGAIDIVGTWITDALNNKITLAVGETATVGLCLITALNTLFAGKTLAAGNNSFTTPYTSPTGRHAVSARYGASWGASAGQEIAVVKIDVSGTQFSIVTPIAIADVDIFSQSIGVIS